MKILAVSNWWDGLKQWQKLAVIGGGSMWLFVTCIYTSIEQRAEEQAEQERLEEVATRAQAIEQLFSEIEIKYGYRPQIDQWGSEMTGGAKPMLLIPQKAWLELPYQQNVLIKDWLRDQYQSRFVIMVGNPTQKGSLTLDRIVYPEE